MTAPTLSASRFSTSPVTVSPVSWAVNSSISPAIALVEPVDAGDAVLHLEDGADFGGVDGREVGGLDFLEEDVLEFAGAQH